MKSYKIICWIGTLMTMGMAVNAQQPDWENEQVFGVNKEPARASFLPYAGPEQALHDVAAASPYYASLDGAWKFHWVKQPSEAPADFYRIDYDAAQWKEIPVPSNMEMQGYIRSLPGKTYALN